MKSKRTEYTDWKRILAVASIMYLPAVGCAAGQQFRAAALPALEGGVNLILDGIVDGLFAAVEVEPDNGRTGSF